MSIEVFDGSYQARLWADAHGDALVEAAVTSGALDWELKRTAWGVVLEIAFKSEAEWELYKVSEIFRSALHTAPNPTTGVLIYRGRSLDGGNPTPRKPKPKSGSGSAALPLPLDTMPFLEALPAFFTDTAVDRRALTTSTN